MSDLSFEHVQGHHYTMFNGLGGMHVEDLYQDSQGFLWIATADGGVSRFDSARFDTFTVPDGLPSQTVMAIAEDPEGLLLFGTFGGGLAAYDGRGFEVYTTKEGLPSNEIVGLQAEPDGSIRVLTGAGVAWFDQGRCKKSITHVDGQPLGRVYDLATDVAGTTWLATWDRGILSLDGRRMDLGDQPVRWPWKFAQDPSGHLWVVFHHESREALIGRYDPYAEQFAAIRVDGQAERAVQQGVRHVRADERGRIWLACRGVVCYDGQAWHPFAPGLPGIDFSNTRLTYEDREGNIWVGLWGGGLIFCDPVSVRFYTEAEGLPDHEVRHLAEDADGRIWIGTLGGMACMEEGHIQPLDMNDAVLAMMADGEGQIWSGGERGRVYQWEGQTPRAIAVGAASNSEEITGLCEDRQGRIWVGTFQGHFGWIEANRFTPFDGWEGEECRALLQDPNGVFWVGFFGKVPALYWDKDDHFCPADIAESETIVYVNVLWEHQNVLWVGTAKGLFTFDHSSKEVRHFTVDVSGLPANGVLALTADPQGHVWLGTSGGGALRYNGETFQNIRLGDSVLGNIVEAVLCDRRGRLWFGTRAGLVAYQPGDTPPRVVIREVLAGSLFAMPQDVSFSEDVSEVRIHFQGISFRTGARQMCYRHRLVGYAPAEQWSAFTAADAVEYPALSVGDYRFEVQTLDRDGLRSEVVSLAIRVVLDDRAKRTDVPTEDRPSAPLMVESQTPVMHEVMRQVEEVAWSDVAVLVLGETGTGKGVLAQTIHDFSQRSDRPFVQVNCGALPPSLVESELFGHEKGSFTGANNRQVGRFEQANGGTLFLDEIGELPPQAQRVLLNVLEEKLLTRVGGEQPVPLDVRIVAATNRDLRQAIQTEAFRGDLFYRLNTFTVELPPLRQRLGDIPDLVKHFVDQFVAEQKRPVPTMGHGVIAHLQSHSWPGNIRELQHVLQRGILLCEGGVLRVEDLEFPLDEPLDEPLAGGETQAKRPVIMDEKQQIVEALQAAGGRIYGERGAARILGMNPERLRSRMRVHGLQPSKKSS